MISQYYMQTDSVAALPHHLMLLLVTYQSPKCNKTIIHKRRLRKQGNLHVMKSSWIRNLHVKNSANKVYSLNFNKMSNGSMTDTNLAKDLPYLFLWISRDLPRYTTCMNVRLAGIYFKCLQRKSALRIKGDTDHISCIHF